MNKTSLRHRALALVVGVFVLAFGGWANADPPSRVARLGYLSGAVSYSPAGEDDWVQATLNRPLTTGDRLWADSGARTEIQIGGAMIRMNGGTSVSILNLDDQIAQLQLAQGALNVRVRHLGPNQLFEVDTPNVAFTLRQPGEYRIEVDPDGIATTIVVRKGQGEVYGDDAAFVIDSRQSYRFMGTGLREYRQAATPRNDAFDRWSSDRDRRYDTSVSARYVSQDVVGYQDLDASGTWRVNATYGNVWFPNQVATGWAPYRDGHWAWIDPWGWTWVDDAPWGFAVSHYGRWTNFRGTWGWVPGPVRTRAYYAPALVVFVGGENFQLSIATGSVGGVAWFPLGPREIYQPAYPVSRRYFENINQSNTVINNTVINNYYNNTNVTNVVYANRQVPGAVVAVPATAFVQSQRVSRVAVHVSPDVLVKAPVAVLPSLAPTERSVRGNAAQGDKPPARVLERPIVARTAPPAPRVGFAAQQPQLAAKPGKPLDDDARKELKPAATAPVVKVVAETKVAPPTQRLPTATAPIAPSDARGRSDDRKGAAPVIADNPRAPTTQAAAPPQAARPAPVARPPEQRGKSDQPGQPMKPGPPVAVTVAEPKIAPTPPAVQSPQQRTNPEQPGKGSQPAQPVATLPPPQRAAQPQVAPAPPVVPPAPPAQSPEQRAKAEQPGKGSQRAPSVPAPPPPQAAAAAKVAPAPQVAPPAPPALPPELRAKTEQPGKGAQRAQPVATPPTPPSAAQPKAAPAPKVASPAMTAPQPAQTVPAVKPAQPQPASIEGPRGQRAGPPASKAPDMKKDVDEQKRDAEERLQKEKRETEERLKKGG